MPHHYIKEHSSECNHGKIYDLGFGGAKYICGESNYVLFFKNNFHLLTINNCMVEYDNYQQIANIIKNSFESTEKPLYDVTKSNPMQDFKEYRLRGIQFSKYIETVHYIYNDAAGKEYGVVSECQYLESVLNQDEMNVNYKIFLDFLDEKGYSQYKKDAEELMMYNYLIIPEEIEIHKTIEHLIKQINNYGNNKESKHKTTA